VFENPKPTRGNRVLVPGMFARLRVPLGEPRKALMIAEQAIGSDQGQKFVFVVDGKKEVQYRRVTTGKVEHGLRVVEEGLQPGEQIIVGGLQRVRPGVAVEAKGVDMKSFSSAANGASKDSAAESLPASNSVPPARQQ
jgi:multidrug efflux system membrane fusion protein